MWIRWGHSDPVKLRTDDQIERVDPLPPPPFTVEDQTESPRRRVYVYTIDGWPTKTYYGILRVEQSCGLMGGATYRDPEISYSLTAPTSRPGTDEYLTAFENLAAALTSAVALCRRLAADAGQVPTPLPEKST